MTNVEMARSSLRQARRILEEAERHHREGVWHLAVRRSQETVELALKAALRAAGVEVPHVHDVGIFVREHAEKLSGPLTKHLDRVVSISRRLREEREISFYGNEEVGTPPEQLYALHDAEEALRDARFIFDLCEGCIPPPP
ncbi:MAG: HEPN domain-containing protein [Candidatus Methylomirabilia bacterium]